MSSASRTLRRHAREMRRKPTRAEARLWYWLRNRKCSGFKFRRQMPIGPYIVDFYCAELQLVVELDGIHHQSSWMSEYDGERTRELEQRGIRILRIPNELLIRDSVLVGEQIDAVIAELSHALERRNGALPHPPSAPSPPCAGEKDLDG